MRFARGRAGIAALSTLETTTGARSVSNVFPLVFCIDDLAGECNLIDRNTFHAWQPEQFPRYKSSETKDALPITIPSMGHNVNGSRVTPLAPTPKTMAVTTSSFRRHRRSPRSPLSGYVSPGRDRITKLIAKAMLLRFTGWRSKGEKAPSSSCSENH